MGLNLGKIAVQAVKEWNPLGPEALKRRATNKDFRKAFRKYRKGKPLTEAEERLMAEHSVKMTLPDGTELQRAEPSIPLRTSTKSLVGGTFLAQIYVQVVSLLPYEGVVMVMTTPEAIAFMSVLLTAAVAKFTKSPAVPGLI